MFSPESALVCHHLSSSPLQFLRSFNDDGTGSRRDVLVTCTGHKHVRLYDTRAARRPVKTSKEICDFPFTTLAQAPGNSVIVADTTGALLRVDLGSMQVSGAYHGGGGSIRQCVEP